MALIFKKLAVAVPDAATEVYLQQLGWDGPVDVYVKNTGAVNFGGAGEGSLQAGPELAGPFVQIDSSLEGLLAGTTKVIRLTQAPEVLRLVLGGAAGATTADIEVTAGNDGA